MGSLEMRHVDAALTSGSVSCLVSPESFPIPAASSRASSLAWVSASTGWMESPAQDAPFLPFGFFAPVAIKKIHGQRSTPIALKLLKIICQSIN